MQCPELQPKRSIMFNEIDKICDAIGLERLGAYGNVFWILLGKPVDNIPIESMKNIWIYSARHISDMYRWKLREGIGKQYTFKHE